MKIKTNYANTPVWREINVKSRIPESLKMLEVMARNIWWAWNDDATEMFRELDPELWRAVGQNLWLCWNVLTTKSWKLCL